MRFSSWLSVASVLVLLPLAACSRGPKPHEAKREIQQDLLILDKALTRFATTKGRQVASIEELIETEWVSQDHLIDPFGRRYGYIATGVGRHDLYTLGQDGREGGEGLAADTDLASLRSRRY